MPATTRDVFINCPFDAPYKAFFRAITFVVVRSGFRPRCALETDDSSENRFEKICKIIERCPYGIHDISRTTPDADSGLPRFNMPLELGIFLAAKRFGAGKQKKKRCLVLDVAPYRYQKFISDISGQDIHAHDDKIETLIEQLAAWLRTQSRDSKVPGGRMIAHEFEQFLQALPSICGQRDLHPDELTFGDYVELVAEYLTIAHPPETPRALDV
jgi:hypothetical protein